jgi:hypothetical protein
MDDTVPAARAPTAGTHLPSQPSPEGSVPLLASMGARRGSGTPTVKRRPEQPVRLDRLRRALRPINDGLPLAASR